MQSCLRSQTARTLDATSAASKKLITFGSYSGGRSQAGSVPGLEDVPHLSGLAGSRIEHIAQFDLAAHATPGVDDQRRARGNTRN
jgi:hypothetical protein